LRPGTLTRALIDTLLACGVNRVSLGVQSFVTWKRSQWDVCTNAPSFLEEIERLRSAGLANINIDLNCRTTAQTAESWMFFAERGDRNLAFHNVSVYMLEVDEDSRLGRELIAGGTRYHAHFVPDEDATSDFYLQAWRQV